jgi:hypothetical protein
MPGWASSSGQPSGCALKHYGVYVDEAHMVKFLPEA